MLELGASRGCGRRSRSCGCSLLLHIHRGGSALAGLRLNGGLLLLGLWNGFTVGWRLTIRMWDSRTFFLGNSTYRAAFCYLQILFLAEQPQNTRQQFTCITTVRSYSLRKRDRSYSQFYVLLITSIKYLKITNKRVFTPRHLLRILGFDKLRVTKMAYRCNPRLK